MLAELDTLRKETIQVLPDATKEAPTGFFAQTWRGPLLPPVGTLERQFALRRISRGDYMPAWQGAQSGVMNKTASTSWEISGPPTSTPRTKAFFRDCAKVANIVLPGKLDEGIEYFQQILRQAHFSKGWTSFCHMGVDYLRQDTGWFWELIYAGDADQPPTGPILGIAHIDALRCIPTGDPEHPVVYYDLKGKMHLLHYMRVAQLIDMLDGDETMPGYGFCALSRAISVVTREVLMGRYVEANLDDKPAPGIILAQGMVKGERERAAATYRDEQNRDERPIWGKQLWFYGADPSVNNLDFKTYAFQTPPEKFNYKEYVELDMNMLALAIGVDVQELWQLTGGNMGSGAQSEVLHQKSRGKLMGTLLTTIERIVNDILPEDYEFAFKVRDANEEQERAATGQAWAGVITSLGSIISTEEARQMAANQIEAVHDAITDASGKVRRLPDVDVGEEADIEASADDTAEVDAAAPTQKPASTESEKGYQSTLLEFESDFASMTKAALDGDMDRRRFAIVSRALLRKYGRKAYMDGLADGGVEADELDDDDTVSLTIWLAEQSSYLTDYADRIYKTDTNMTPDARAEAWGNKSLTGLYQQGVLNADANGLYSWVLGDTEEHCATCLAASSQQHRLKQWFASGIIPKSDALACHGYYCDCKLVKTKGKPYGRFTTIPRAA